MAGDSGDLNLIHLGQRARRRGFRVLELGAAGSGTSWDFAFDNEDTRSGRLEVAGDPVTTAEVAGFFVRTEREKGLKWLNWISGVVVNRPAAVRNCAATDQMALLSAAGFAVPSATQRCLPGRHVRVYTVADRAFAAEISLTGEGKWFSAGTCVYQERGLPDVVAELCCRTAAREKLWIAAFDFRVTLEAGWVCIGLDPQPNFVLCERATGQPMADAILDLFEARVALRDPGTCLGNLGVGFADRDRRVLNGGPASVDGNSGIHQRSIGSTNRGERIIARHLYAVS
ncbi:MAG: hypothetical protein ACREMA_06740 [Longimicrobiales bacterium]